MSDKILFVDDDINLLASIRRNLGRNFKITTAASAEEALELAGKDGPFGVVVSDQRMPRVEGVAFLSEMAYRHPYTVRMMLTGNADQSTAAEAVNQGKIFRFFSKPCSIDAIAEGLLAALKQHRLITAERELLEKTLAGSVKLLTDVLALLDPEAVGRTRRMRDWGRLLSKRMGLTTNAWELDIALMLHAIGDITAPPDIRAKARTGQALSVEEQEILA
jgi:DNA-binding NtrC family response regulator